MRHALAGLALGLASPALACEPPTIIVNADGTAEWIVTENTNRTALEDFFGPAPSPAHMLVVTTSNRTGIWVDPRSDPLEIAAAFGADGFAYSGPEECIPPDLPRNLDDIPETHPIELFPDAATACAGGPRSGTWRAEIGATRMEGCPAMMQQAFPQSAGALPGMTGERRWMEFSCPFNPDALELSRNAGVRWQPAGAKRWVTTDMAADAFRQIPAGQGGGSQIRWEMTAVSPNEITFGRSIEIVLPAEAAAIMGASPEGCRVTGTDRWIRVGD